MLVLNKATRRVGLIRTTGGVKMCAVIASCLISSPTGGITSRT